MEAEMKVMMTMMMMAVVVMDTNGLPLWEQQFSL